MPEQEKNPFKGHTEGPWDIEYPCGFPYTGTYIVSHKANEKKGFHHYILEVRQLRERAESDANAALVRAAPALLRQRDELVKALRAVAKVREHVIAIEDDIIDCDADKSVPADIAELLVNIYDLCDIAKHALAECKKEPA